MYGRAAKGIWRKSGDRPVGVDWNERVINVHEGGWNYVVNTIGIAPSKFVSSDGPLLISFGLQFLDSVECRNWDSQWSNSTMNSGFFPFPKCPADRIVGTATPLADELEEYKLSWRLSTGDTLIISRQMSDLDWERHLEFTLRTPGPGAGLVSTYTCSQLINYVTMFLPNVRLRGFGLMNLRGSSDMHGLLVPTQDAMTSARTYFTSQAIEVRMV